MEPILALIFMFRNGGKKMAQQALSTLGIKFGWGIGTMKKAPTAFKQIEGCISIGGVEVSKDCLVI